MRLVKATIECAFCDRKFHQIDGTEERARSVVHAALDRHVVADHPDRYTPGKRHVGASLDEPPDAVSK